MDNIFETFVDALKNFEDKKVKVGFVFLNAFDSLLEGQKSLLNDRYGEGNWGTLYLPSNELSISEQDHLADELAHYISGYVENDIDIEFVFDSQIPFLLKELTWQSKTQEDDHIVELYKVKVFYYNKDETNNNWHIV